MEQQGDLSRFFGRWHATIGGEQVFLEFYPDGRLFYTGLWGEDTKEFMHDMRHPLEFGRPRPGPAWEVRGGLLVIFLLPRQEFKFEYAFSDLDTNLVLRSLQSKESLTFTRKTR